MSAEERVDDRLEILERRVRRHRPVPRVASVKKDIRTCTHCGARATFLYDPRGGWASCTACGQYA